MHLRLCIWITVPRLVVLLVIELGYPMRYCVFCHLFRVKRVTLCLLLWLFSPISSKEDEKEVK